MELDGGEDAADAELLERARRLCLAASQLEAPVLPSFARLAYLAELASDSGVSSNQAHETVSEGQAPDAGGECRRVSSGESADNCGSTGNNERSQDKVPETTSTPTRAAKPKRVLRKKEVKALERLPEETQRLADERKKSKEREIEHARQRARARVARTNQQEQQEAHRELEKQRRDALEAAERIAEKIRVAKESRLRAEARIHMKRQMRPAERPPSGVHKKDVRAKLPAASGKIESFRRKTLKRLKRASTHSVQTDDGTQQTRPERNEAAEEAQRDLERGIRLQTAKRLRRMQKLEEDLRRKEREEFEQGLRQFKNKQRELDRVAKGLGPSTKSPSLPKLLADKTDTSVDTPTDSKEQDGCVLRIPEPSIRLIPLASNHDSPTKCPQQDDSSSDSGSSDSDLASSSVKLRHDQPLPAITSPTHNPPQQRRKLPAWKQPPVPVLPSECYLPTATVSCGLPTYHARAGTSGNAYKPSPDLRKTIPSAPGSAAAQLGSATRLRAQQIAKSEAALHS